MDVKNMQMDTTDHEEYIHNIEIVHCISHKIHKHLIMFLM